MWHSFWHSIWHSFWHSIWNSIWHIFWHLSWGPAVPTGLERSAVEVQRCPLDSRGPRLRSSSAHWYPEMIVEGRAHWDRELAVEVQQCPLRSGAGEEARKRGGEGEGGGGRRGEQSNNPQLGGGEKEQQKSPQVEDSVQLFTSDTLKGGAKKPELVKVLCGNSGPDVPRPRRGWRFLFFSWGLRGGGEYQDDAFHGF